MDFHLVWAGGAVAWTALLFIHPAASPNLKTISAAMAMANLIAALWR